MAVAVVIMCNIAAELRILPWEIRYRTGQVIGGGITTGGDAGVVEFAGG